MNRNHSRRRLSFAAIASAVLLFSSVSALQAQTYTWMGPGANWNTASNWSPAVIPNDPNATVNFTGNAIGNINISSSVLSQVLLFSNPTGSYTLTSSPGVTLSGLTGINLAANVTGTQTVDLAYNLFGNVLFPNGFNFQVTNNSNAPGTTLLIGPNTVIGASGGGAGAVNFTGAGNTTFSGSFADLGSGNYVTGGLYKNGTGTLTLSNPNTVYGGNTFVNSGTLQLGAGTAIPGGTNVTVAAGAQFNTGGFSNSAGSALDTLALTGGTFRVPSGSGDYHLRQLTMTGNSTVDFTGSNVWLHFANGGAGITVSGGDSTWIGSGSARVVNETAAILPINVASGSSLALGVILSNGGGQFRLTGGGFVTLTNTGNSGNIINDTFLFTNDLSTNAGAGAFGTLGTGFFTNSGSLQYTGGTATSAKSITLGGSFPVVQVGTPGANLTLNGTLSGSGGMHAAGASSPLNPSTLTLTGTNSYAGNTLVSSDAILSIPTIADTGMNSPIGTGGGISLGTASARGTLMLTGTNPNYSTNRTISVLGADTSGDGAAINVQNAATSLTLNGQITGAGSFIKTGLGTLVLNNNLNNHTGGTYVDAGTLRLAAPLGIPFLGNVTVAAGAVFDNGGQGTGAGDTIGTLTLNGGTYRSTLSPGAVYVINKLVMNGGVIDATGAANFSGLTLNQAGASIIVNGDSSWTGPAGAYVANALGAELPITIAPNVTLTSGISLARAGGVPANTFLVTGGGTFHQTSVPNYIARVRVNQARFRLDNLTNVAPATFDLTLDNGTLAYGGPTQSYLAQFTIGSNGGNIEIGNAASTLTLTGAIGNGGGPLTKTGPGTLVLANAGNLYSGGIVVNAGRLDVGDDSHLGLANPTVNAFGTLRYTASATTARTFNLNNGALEAPSGVTLSMNGASVGGGFLRGNGIYNLTGGSSLTGVTTFTNTNLNVTGPASITNFSHNGNLTGNSGQSLSMNYGTNGSAGRMTMNGTANVSEFVSNGLLTVPNGGLINNAGSNMVLGGGSTTFVGAVGNLGGKIDLGGNQLLVRGGLLVTNSGTFGSGNGVRNGQTVADFGALVKGTGPYQSVITQNGGQYLPGNSPGTSQVGDFAINGGGGLIFQITDAGPSATFPSAPGTAGNNPGWGKTEIFTSLNFTATPSSPFTITMQTQLPPPAAPDTPGLMSSFDPNRAYQWLIFDLQPGASFTGTFDPSAISFATAQFVNPTLGGIFSLARNGGQIFLTFTPVPEPASIFAFAGLGLAVGHRVRRRIKRSCEEPRTK